jgi:putative MFS transporter
VSTPAPPVMDTRFVIGSAADVLGVLNRVGMSSGAKLKRGRGWIIILIALGGVFIDAYDLTSLGIGAVQLRHEFHLSAWTLGAVSASMAMSACLGALFGGYFVDRIGRLPMFLLDLYLFVGAAIGAALAPNVTVLVIFRVLMGLGIGLDFPVALSFVAEFAAQRRKGRAVNLSYINWYLAAITGFIVTYLGYLLGAGPHLWRYAVGFGAVPAIVILVLRFMYMFESPMWLARRGDLAGAASALQKVYGVEVVAGPEASKPPPRRSLIGTYGVLFSPLYRRRAILAGAIGCLQSIEYYAVVFYLPIISQIIFGATLFKAIVGGIFFSAFGLVGSLIQAMICDRTGLRPLTLGGSLVAAAALVGMGLGHAAGLAGATALMVAVFMLGHTLGPGPQGMAYGTLSFPTEMRGTAVGWTQGMLRLGSVTGFFFFPVLIAALGFNRTFPLLAVSPLLIIVITLIIKWDPIGKDADLEAMELAKGIDQPATLPGVRPAPTRRAQRPAAPVQPTSRSGAEPAMRQWVSLELPIKVLVDTAAQTVDRVVIQVGHLRLARDFDGHYTLLDEQLEDHSDDIARWRSSVAIAERASWPHASTWENTHLDLKTYLRPRSDLEEEASIDQKELAGRPVNRAASRA